MNATESKALIRQTTNDHVAHGRLLAGARRAAGFTQEKLSATTGIPVTMIQQYEQGRCLPGTHRVVCLLHTLDIDPGEWEAVHTS